MAMCGDFGGRTQAGDPCGRSVQEGRCWQHVEGVLTPKEERFVEEYLIDLNATAAAARAGYSGRSAGDIGHELLRRERVATAIQEAKARRSERTEITADRVLEELRRIALADVRRLFTWDEERAVFVPSRDLTEEEAAAVASVKADTTHTTSRDGTRETNIKLELKLHDKLGALREIGKHLGIKEQLELSGPDGQPIPTTIAVRFVDADGDR